MGVISVYLTKEEKELVKNYCKKHNLTVSAAFKSALLEEIEDYYETRWAEKCIERERNDPNQETYTFEEVIKMLNLNLEESEEGSPKA